MVANCYRRARFSMGDRQNKRRFASQCAEPRCQAPTDQVVKGKPCPRRPSTQAPHFSGPDLRPAQPNEHRLHPPLPSSGLHFRQPHLRSTAIPGPARRRSSKTPGKLRHHTPRPRRRLLTTLHYGGNRMREARERIHVRRDVIKCLAPCAGHLARAPCAGALVQLSEATGVFVRP
jgi:hypothetical protein